LESGEVVLRAIGILWTLHQLVVTLKEVSMLSAQEQELVTGPEISDLLHRLGYRSLYFYTKKIRLPY